MKRRNVLDVLAAARPADLGGPGKPVIAEPPHREMRRGRWIGAVAASLATAVIIGVTALPRLIEGDVSTGHTLGSPAAGLLDTAAERAAAQQDASGRYWRVEGYVLGEEIIGSRERPYRIKTRAQSSRWVPRDPAEALVLAERGMPSVPASAVDEDAWRRAGAPELCGNDTDCENDTAPLGRTRYMFMPSNWPFGEEGLTLPVNELLTLPQEPGALKEQLLSFWPAYSKSMANWPSPPAGAALPRKDSWLLGLSLDLLQYGPLSAGTRAALYRMVADLPGTRALGRVRDAEGRWGLAVGWTDVLADGQTERRLIVNETDGDLLSIQHVIVKPWTYDPPGITGLTGLPTGTVYEELVYHRPGWTDTPPQLPKACRSLPPVEGKECVE
ncbi:CU044_5270 family protein [Nonomuraea sp. JJY05]|uniref:CU044_5270 family protein n=1 Tax=Nonomuraea sp. JJY05 TaxID=3350255 RepID=UPI00373E3183